MKKLNVMRLLVLMTFMTVFFSSVTNAASTNTGALKGRNITSIITLRLLKNKLSQWIAGLPSYIRAYLPNMVCES